MKNIENPTFECTKVMQSGTFMLSRNSLRGVTILNITFSFGIRLGFSLLQNDPLFYGFSTMYNISNSELHKKYRKIMQVGRTFFSIIAQIAHFLQLELLIHFST